MCQAKLITNFFCFSFLRKNFSLIILIFVPGAYLLFFNEEFFSYMNDIDFEVPESVKITVPKPTEIIINGIDQQIVGQVAANIREKRKPEPYKGKGIRYKDEYVFAKEGKKK